MSNLPAPPCSNACVVGSTSMQLCAVALVATGLVHSVLGERRLITPLLGRRDGVLGSDLARFLLRGVWHFMTIPFCTLAAIIWAGTGSSDNTVTVALAATGIGVGGAGIADAVGSRGRHVGWPLLVSIGALAAVALMARR